MKEEKVDIWKDINGFNGKYQVSYSGQVRRVYKKGKTKVLAQFKKAGKGKRVYRDRLMVHLTADDGKSYTILVHQLVARHFLEKPMPGQVPYHKNGCVMDNWASNLEYIDKKKLGELTGASSRRKTVVKINRDGEIVDCYSSAREASRKNFMSYQAVIDRCNLVNVKRTIFAPDGYAYSWEDDERKLNSILRKIELETKDDDQDEIVKLKAVNSQYVYEF